MGDNSDTTASRQGSQGQRALAGAASPRDLNLAAGASAPAAPSRRGGRPPSPHREEVLDRWARGEDTPSIALRLKLSPGTVAGIVSRARERRDPRAEERHSFDTALVPQRQRRPSEAAPRTCLGCRKVFASKHKGNRLCEGCRDANRAVSPFAP